MKRFSTYVGLIVGAVMVLLLASMLVSAQDGATNVRVAHFSPDAPAVDVYVNGEVAMSGVEFGAITDFSELTAGTYSVAVAAAGTSLEEAVIGPVDLTLESGAYYTVAAVGSVEAGTLFPQVIVDDYSGLADGQARVTTFHGIEGAPIVDVRANGVVIVDALAFPGTVGNNDGAFPVDVNAGTYDITVTPNDATEPVIVSAEGVAVEAGTFYFVAAIGTPDSPSVAVATYTMPVVEDAGPLVELDDVTTIADVLIAASNAEPSQFDTLLTAVQAADPAVLEALNDSEAELTLFAPSNLAFENLRASVGDETFNSILADPALLTSILTYHVVPQVADSAAVLALLDANGDQVAVQALEERDIVISRNENGIFLNNAPLRVEGGLDYLADNGVVHIIDAVLIPPAVQEQLDAAAAEASEPAGATSEQIQSAADRIFSLGSSDADSEEGEGEEEEAEAVEEPVEEEPAGATSDQIQSAADRIFSLGGDSDAAEETEGEEAAGEETEEVAELATIVDIAAGDENFSTLVMVLSEVSPEALELLSDPTGDFTVFAPTNAAFDDLTAALGVSIEDAMAFPDILEGILTYHVVEGAVPASTVLTLDDQEVVTLQGEPIIVSVDGETVMLNGTATVTTTDIFAANGVIHVIDTVLLSPSTIATLESLGLAP